VAAPRIAAVNTELIVEGELGGESFAGRVIAVAVDDGHPVLGPQPAATWFLVADDRRPAPIWVAAADVTGKRLGG
jgi:hypothetical protein